MPRSWFSALSFILTCTCLISCISTQPWTRPVASASSTLAPQVHTIKVGAGGFSFFPRQLINIPVKDIVSFEFYPPDHSVAQAAYGLACVPYELSGKDRVGFWSETQYVYTNADTTTYNVTINSTEPIFFYCAAPDSCNKQLMVGAINPNETQTLDGQIEAARTAKHALKPGEPIPKEGHGATPSAAPGTRTVSVEKMSTATIVGIVVGSAAFVCICAVLFFLVGRNKSLKEVIRHQDTGTAMKPLGVGRGFADGYCRQSAFSQMPTAPHGGYSQDLGSPTTSLGGQSQNIGCSLRAYASPHISSSGVQNFCSEQDAEQPFVAELHSPMLENREAAAELAVLDRPVQERKI